MTAPCRTSGCEKTSRSDSRGHCLPHYIAFCRRAGSLRWEGFPQQLADALAAADYQVLGHVAPVSLPVWPDIAKETAA